MIKINENNKRKFNKILNKYIIGLLECYRYLCIS